MSAVRERCSLTAGVHFPTAITLANTDASKAVLDVAENLCIRNGFPREQVQLRIEPAELCTYPSIDQRH